MAVNNAVKPRKQIKQTYDAGILRGGDVSTLPVGFPICSLDVRFKTSKKIQIDKTFQVFSQFASSMGGKRKGKGKGKGKGLAAWLFREVICVSWGGDLNVHCLGYRFSKEKKATWRRCAKSRVWTTGSLARGLQNPTCPNAISYGWLPGYLY